MDGICVYSCGPCGDLYCIDTNTRKPVWNKNVWKDFGGEKIPTWAIAQCPLVYGDLLIVGGYELGATMIKVEKTADGTYGATELFTTVEFGDQTKPPILYNGYFYAQYGTNNRRDGLVCMKMDGQIMWKTKRAPDFNKGSMILAD